MRAFQLDFDGTREQIPIDRALAISLHTPVVLEGALAEVGYLDQLSELFLDEIAALRSPAVAEDVRAAGLERLHEFLDADEVAALIARLGPRTLELAVPVSRALVEAVTTPPRPHYFICARTFVRAMVPYGVAQRSPEVMEAKHLFGHMLPAEPHRDFWLSHARNSRSLWSAVGPVREGNSIMVFEGSDADPGRFVSPALERGDTFLFDSDSLHASVCNETDETRVAVGNRITVGRRLRFGPGTHWRPWYDASLIDTPLAPLATLQSRLSRAAWRRWRWRTKWEREQRALASSTTS